MRRGILVRAAVVMVAALLLATPAALTSPAQATPRVARDPAVIRTWDAIAVRTIVVQGLKPPPVTQLYLGFVSAAMYNAVVTIDGRFAPYTQQPRAHAHASPEAAAATAAYRVLSVYFPASAEQLTADYQASLARIPNGVGKVHGIRVGEEAARAIVRLREGDGRDAAITLNVTPTPGVWRPTPPAFAPMLAPWLGFVRPLLLASPTQLPLPGPDRLTSTAYTRDFDEVKAAGAAASATRTPAQTDTARFWNDNAPVQYQAGLRDLATRHRLDIDHSARLGGVGREPAVDGDHRVVHGGRDKAQVELGHRWWLEALDDDGSDGDGVPGPDHGRVPGHVWAGSRGCCLRHRDGQQRHGHHHNRHVNSDVPGHGLSSKRLAWSAWPSTSRAAFLPPSDVRHACLPGRGCGPRSGVGTRLMSAVHEAAQAWR